MIGKKLNYKTELILYKDKRAKLFILEIEVKAFKIKIYPCLKKKWLLFTLSKCKNTIFAQYIGHFLWATDGVCIKKHHQQT